MKNALRISLPVLFSVLAFGASAPLAFAATATSVDLGTASDFAALSKAQITDVNSSVITGDVGASPITGASIHLSCSEVTGTIWQVNDAYTGGFNTNTTCAVSGTANGNAGKTHVDNAIGNMETAYASATDVTANPAGTGDFLNVGTGTLGTPGVSQNFVPGVYTWNTAVTIPTDIYLSGSATDVWVFQISETLTVSSDVTIHLTGGAEASNVFWAVAGNVELGTNSTFEGTILTTGTSHIVLLTGATLHGRALSDGEIWLQSATITVPTPAPASCTGTIGTSVFVSTSGSDTNNDGSEFCPFATIQTAINDTNTLSGDTIHVAAGTYTEQVTINKSLDLIGEGTTTTTILAPATRTGSVSQVTNIGTIIHDYLLAAYATSGTIDVRVQGFTLDVDGKNKTAGTGQMDGVFFRDVKDAGGTAAGLFSSAVHNFAATPAYEGFGVVVYGDSLLTLSGNDIRDYTRDGISINRKYASGSTPNVTISGNTVTDTVSSALNGISVDAVTAGAVTDNTVIGNSGNAPMTWASGGIVLWSSTGVPITGNHVNDNFYGIDLYTGSHDITISSNDLTNNIKRGISLGGSSATNNNTVSSNTIIGPADGTDDVAIGVSNDSTGNMIGGPNPADGNTITMATSGTGNLYAIHIDGSMGSGSNTIKYNTITGGQRAVQFDGPPGDTGLTTVANNTISDQAYGGITAFNNGDLTITNNTLTSTVRPMEFSGPHNLTITGNTVDSSTYAGINLGSFSGAANVNNNIIHNIAADNNGIWAQASGTSLTISGNTIYGIAGTGGGGRRGIQIDASADNANINGNEIHDVTGFAGIVIDTGATGAKINGNYVHNNEQGMVVNEQTAEFKNNRILNNRWGVDLNSVGATFVLLNNSIADNNINPADSYNLGMWEGTANAIRNWWGSATGPAAGTIAGNAGDVTFDPWYTNNEMTILSNSTVTNAAYTSPISGQIDLPVGATEITLTDATVLDLSNATTSMVSTDVTVGDHPVTLTQSVTLQSGIDGQDVVLTNSDLADASASIPDGTIIQGPTGWDGTVAPPTTGDSSGTAPNGFTVGSTIDVGSPTVVLLFDQPATIILPGITGTVGYKPSGSDTWTTISTTCTGTYNSPTGATFPGECAISNGADTKILTYHFTTFGGLNPIPAPTPTPVPVVNGSILSFSGGGGGTPNPLPGQTIATTVTGGITTTTTTTTNQGQVLGAATYNFTMALAIGSRGAEVTALQQYLIDNGFSVPAGATGYYGSQTRAAVIAFQKAHGIAQVGNVGPLTRAELNKGTVATGKTNLTRDQANAIISIIQSFGADASVVAKVKASLGQ